MISGGAAEKDDGAPAVTFSSAPLRCRMEGRTAQSHTLAFPVKTFAIKARSSQAWAYVRCDVGNSNSPQPADGNLT